MSSAAPHGRPEAADCFHCGLAVPAGATFGFEADGGWRAFCCAGCQAVSAAIHGRGLDDYYRLRDAAPGRAPQDPRCDPAAYDDTLVQSRFVRAAAPGLNEADLVLDGIRCAACTWLVEQALARVPGVESADVNYTTRRARVRWRAAQCAPSAVLAAIRDVGYEAWPYEEKRLAQVEARERRSMLRRLFVAGFGMMQVMMYAVPGYIAADGDIGAEAQSLMRWAGFALTLPVITYASAPFFRGAWRDLRFARLGMDVPVALGLGAAFAASVVSTLNGSGPVYFDSIAMFVFLLTLGRMLELGARSRAAASLAHLARLVPQSAERLRGEDTLAADTVPVAALAPRDLVLVRPGGPLPADGVLASDAALVSEALLSGESRALEKRRGDMLTGGAVNAGGALVMRVTRVGAESTLSTIQRLMERALAERPRWVEAAQRASGAFVGLVLIAALAAFTLWMPTDAARALWIAISVLVVTCPCALSLATPVALAVATGEAARRGFVVTRGHAFEALAGATDIVFDKTGTLTRGAPRLLETLPLRDWSVERSIAAAAALGRASTHPLDRALAAAAGGATIAEASRVQFEPGEGIEGRVAGRRLRLGRREFVAALHGLAAPLAWIHGGDTVVWIGDERGWIAAFRLGDALRDEAKPAIARLKASGCALHLLTGDDAAVAQRVADELGIERVEARATPQRKLAYIRALQLRGARVAMVGDGVNDAPVLAQADVSVAMGGGADLAQVRADAVLLSDSLADLAGAARLARRTRAVIRQNIAWALAYNLVVVPLAFAGMVTPLVAAVGMSASSLAVVGNALRLRRRGS